MYTNFYSKSIQPSYAQLSPYPKGRKNLPKLSIMWKILALIFGQIMGPPFKTSIANLTKNPTCLEYDAFIYYFGPHDSEHHPTSVDTFHPHRLPPNGPHTPSKYWVAWHPFRVAWALHAKSWPWHGEVVKIRTLAHLLHGESTLQQMNPTAHSQTQLELLET
jgi:hypothetical protein